MAFKPPRTGDPTLDRALDAAADEFRRQEVANKRRNAVLFTEKAITTAGLELEHGLGYVPQHVTVTMKDANVDIYASRRTATTVTLAATGSATISVEVW